MSIRMAIDLGLHEVKMSEKVGSRMRAKLILIRYLTYMNHPPMWYGRGSCFGAYSLRYVSHTSMPPLCFLHSDSRTAYSHSLLAVHPPSLRRSSTFHCLQTTTLYPSQPVHMTTPPVYPKSFSPPLLYTSSGSWYFVAVLRTY